MLTSFSLGLVQGPAACSNYWAAAQVLYCSVLLFLRRGSDWLKKRKAPYRVACRVVFWMSAECMVRGTRYVACRVVSVLDLDGPGAWCQLQSHAAQSSPSPSPSPIKPSWLSMKPVARIQSSPGLGPVQSRSPQQFDLLVFCIRHSPASLLPTLLYLINSKRWDVGDATTPNTARAYDMILCMHMACMCTVTVTHCDMRWLTSVGKHIGDVWRRSRRSASESETPLAICCNRYNRVPR